MRPRVRVGLGLLILGGALLAFSGASYVREYLAVDGCLDSGGSFDYRTAGCDHQQSHPYVPYVERHPRSIPVAAAAAALGAIGTLLLVRRRSV